MTITYYQDLEQGSEEWHQARCGLVTASTVRRLLTPTLKIANNDTSRGLALTLVAERITGYVEPEYEGRDMWRGHEEEPLARAAYAELTGCQVTEMGFVTRDLGNGRRVGYSPDAFVDEDGLLEIKSRIQKIQLQTILDDQIPSMHIGQMQCGLYVTGRAWIDYVSYGGGMPLWVKRMFPDDEWFAAIENAVDQFETNADEMLFRYKAATVGLPVMERTPEYGEIEVA